MVPNYLRKQALTYLDNVYPVKFRKEYFSMELIEKSKQIIKLLSDSLSNAKYFNTGQPNEIDALIFGYLAVILKTELPRLNNLQQFVKEQQNLVDYVNRILKEFFPEYVDQSDPVQPKTKDLKENFESVSWRSVFLVGLFAITSNLLYILYVVSDDDETTDSESEAED